MTARARGAVTALVLWCASLSGVDAQTGSASASSPMPLNLLTSPSSPAFVLLGIEPTSIERPGSVTDIAVSLRSATDDFSVLPESYAISVAPYWLTSAADGLDYETFASGAGAPLRTATLSVATSTAMDPVTSQSITSLGLGFRMSLAQGPIARDEAYVSRLDSLRASLDDLTEELQALHLEKLSSDPVLQELTARSDAAADGSPERAVAELLIAQRTQELAQEAEEELREGYADEIETIRRRAAELPLRRTGFNLDAALGTVLDFPGGDVNQGDMRSGGAWLTGSLEYPWGAALAVGRLLRDWTDDMTSFDLGGRLVLDNMEGLSLSAEGLGRIFPNIARDTEWRLALTADYSIGQNRVLSFTFGRDFEGRRTNDLILALNFALGFGAMRPAL